MGDEPTSCPNSLHSIYSKVHVSKAKRAKEEEGEAAGLKVRKVEIARAAVDFTSPRSRDER